MSREVCGYCGLEIPCGCGVIQRNSASAQSDLDRLRKENAALRDVLALCLEHGAFPQGSGILHDIRAALQGAKDD